MYSSTCRSGAVGDFQFSGQYRPVFKASINHFQEPPVFASRTIFAEAPESAVPNDFGASLCNNAIGPSVPDLTGPFIIQNNTIQNNKIKYNTRNWRRPWLAGTTALVAIATDLLVPLNVLSRRTRLMFTPKFVPWVVTSAELGDHRSRVDARHHDRGGRGCNSALSVSLRCLFVV